MYEILHNNFLNKVTYFLYDLFDAFTQEEKVKTFTISIPSDVLLRSKLICEFIESEIHDDFNLDNMLMLLYLDFIKDSIENYNPKTVYTLLNKSYYDTRNIVIASGNDSVSIDRAPVALSDLKMSISTEDYKKGQLILDEIYEIYQSRYSFAKLIECLWMNFIYSYKTDENKKAYRSIVKMLKECLK